MCLESFKDLPISNPRARAGPASDRAGSQRHNLDHGGHRHPSGGTVLYMIEVPYNRGPQPLGSNV